MRRPRVSGEVSFFLHTCKKNETSVYPQSSLRSASPGGACGFRCRFSRWPLRPTHPLSRMPDPATASDEALLIGQQPAKK